MADDKKKEKREKKNPSSKTGGNDGYIMSSINPKWIGEKMISGDLFDIFQKLFMFYVINTPCTSLSNRGIDLTDYGWSKNVWKGKLREHLLGIANLQKNETFVVKNINDMKEICKGLSSDDFYENRDIERVAISKANIKGKGRKYNEFLSICYHIRNSFAHGRFEIYDYKESKNNTIFVMEDVYQGKVSARMVLKQSTLIKWMEILQSGKYPENKNIKQVKSTKEQTKSTQKKCKKGADKKVNNGQTK